MNETLAKTRVINTARDLVALLRMAEDNDDPALLRQIERYQQTLDQCVGELDAADGQQRTGHYTSSGGYYSEPAA